MEWEKLKAIVKEVENATNDLQRGNEKVQEICNNYIKQLCDELATPQECEDVGCIDKQLQEIEEDLKRVLGKASDKVVIEFVGTTSSGKSTLINALMKEERLPAGCAETTMCLIEICTTDEEDWSVKVNRNTLSNTMNTNDIKDLLNALSNDDFEDQREKLGIHEGSVVRVYWPRKFSAKVLPDNVVLVDSPGFGEDDKCDKVVKDSCQKADVIVAVMDSKTPSKGHVTKLVKEVNCQYAFGVFTKWDEYLEQKKKESSAISVETLRKKNTRKYLEGINSEEQRSTDKDIFFVDSLSVLRNPEEGDGSPGAKEFYQFEKQLAKSSKELKGELLKKEIKSVTDKAEVVYDKFKEIVDTRKKEKIERLQKKIDSLEDGRDDFDKICENFKKSIDNEKDDISIYDIIGIFESNVKTANLSEEDASKQLCDTVNKKMKETIRRKTTNVNKAFKDWKDRMADKFSFSQGKLLITESDIPQLNSVELPNDIYNSWLDLHSYYTNNYLMGAVATGMLGLVCGVGFGMFNIVYLVVVRPETGGKGLHSLPIMPRSNLYYQMVS